MTTINLIDRLRVLRPNRMTYKDISERSGVSFNTIEAIFSGRNVNPTLQTITKIADAINVDISANNKVIK